MKEISCTIALFPVEVCDEEGNVTVTEIPLIHLLPAELAPAGWNLSSDRMETQLWLSFTALRFFSIVMNHLAYE